MLCAFAGHRPQRLPWGMDERDERCIALKSQLERAIWELYSGGCCRFLCGMAMGCDWYFCDAVLKLRETEPVTLEAAVPCPSQPNAWPEDCRARYYRLLAACDRRTVLEPDYSRGCMLRRNQWMIDRADCLLTVYDGSRGGTGAAVAYAKKRGVLIVPLWR